MLIVIITGLSGSGKSTAIKALEDNEYYCVDNLPATLLPKFIELCKGSGEISKVGFGVDVRGADFLNHFPSVLKELQDAGHDVDIIFLESSDDVLIRRFSETRRLHPLAPSGRLAEGIEKEKKVLAPIRKEATKVIDTSECNVHQLKGIISDYVRNYSFSNKMILNLISFGFKYGMLYEADIVMDVRFLPNPNFVSDLKHLSGENARVADYALNSDLGQGFMKRFSDLLTYLLPNYIREGKSYLTIGVGCTGGRHRSVAVVEELSRVINGGECALNVIHRDKDRI